MRFCFFSYMRLKTHYRPVISIDPAVHLSALFSSTVKPIRTKFKGMGPGSFYFVKNYPFFLTTINTDFITAVRSLPSPSYFSFCQVLRFSCLLHKNTDTTSRPSPALCAYRIYKKSSKSDIGSVKSEVCATASSFFCVGSTKEEE